ncbi:phage head closure protein [Cohnella luojiensis]|uniref:Head-tail adaptor protein n=1 Tax=Cohnella luojiensis TaxID=652876 RepID=A0A4Y8MB32_9BACL|nr:phage head closure protein [Cohnella luojiensis]TFE30833.1 head-tail adaptor protein [Cohnella luojiensis]
MSCTDKGKSLIARLNKCVVIQRPAGTVDEYNQPLDAWVDVATTWAAIEPLRGQEFFAAMRENAEVTTRIRIRYRPGIDRTMRVNYNGLPFEILHIINPEMANKELQLMCKERQ